ncbi:MAG: hypothetical protein WC716_13265 [Chitinophagaceae bacterium]
MKETLLKGWNLLRFLRLGMGAIMAAQFFHTNDKLLGFIAALLLYQALFNKGSCANNKCTPRHKTISVNKGEEISFEEIK